MVCAQVKCMYAGNEKVCHLGCGYSEVLWEWIDQCQAEEDN
jgi:hypothetical protein